MTVYVKAEESVCVNSAAVRLKDVISFYCSRPESRRQIENIRLYRFSGSGNQRKVFSILKVVELIKMEDSEAEIINMGPDDFIVYYKKSKTEQPWVHYGKIAFVAAVAFFGAGFSIMAYNNDVGIEKLFETVYKLVMGRAPEGANLLHLSYTIGLAAGIILFFNHAGKMSLTDDPTPFEVQMRLYERDVNDTLMIDADRKEEEEDV